MAKLSKEQAQQRDALAQALDEVRSEIEELANELQEAFYDRSERWQESDAGHDALEQIEKLQEITESLDMQYQELIFL